MVSLGYEVKQMVIKGTAKSTDSSVSDTRFELPVTVRIPKDCDEVELTWEIKHG